MNRAERRRLLKGTMQLAPTSLAFEDIDDDGSKATLVAICRAFTPTAPQGFLADKELVNATYELIRNGYLEVYLRWHERGCDVFTELKIPGKGSMSIMGPLPAIRYLEGSVH